MLAAWAVVRKVLAWLPLWAYALALALGWGYVGHARNDAARADLASLRAQVKADGMALVKASEAGIEMTKMQNAQNRAKEQEQRQREELANQTLDQALVVIADTRADVDRLARLRDAEARARRRAAGDPGKGATLASCGGELETTGLVLERALQSGASCALGAETDNAASRSVFEQWPR